MMLVYAWDEDSAPDSWRPRIVGRGGSNGRHRTLEPVSALGGRRHSPRGIRPGTHSNLSEISRLVSPDLSHNARSAGCARRSAPSPPRLLAKGRVNLRQRYGSQSRSEEHTSELQSRGHLVCRLLLEKKKNQPNSHNI